jgi:hypothetical protein
MIVDHPGDGRQRLRRLRARACFTRRLNHSRAIELYDSVDVFTTSEATRLERDTNDWRRDQPTSSNPSLVRSLSHNATRRSASRVAIRTARCHPRTADLYARVVTANGVAVPASRMTTLWISDIGIVVAAAKFDASSPEGRQDATVDSAPSFVVTTRS